MGNYLSIPDYIGKICFDEKGTRSEIYTKKVLGIF
jgi:hypothetical protein